MNIDIFDWYTKQPKEIQGIIISVTVPFITFLLGGLAKWLYDRYSLKFKMKTEYYFVQKVKIKKKLSAQKTPLIKAAEDLNYRLWNLSENIGKGWHNKEEEEWQIGDKYYLKSTVYRLLVFFYYTLKAEHSIYNFDLSLADNSDKKYLKYIKTLKHFFCEAILLKDLNYDSSKCTNHFYKDDLAKFVNYLKEEKRIITYQEFSAKFHNNYSEIKPVIQYVTGINPQAGNLNYNVVMAFHLFIILFLNEYGLDFHHTSRRKMLQLTQRYSSLKIKKGFYDFLERNKMLKEANWIVENMSLQNR